MPGRCGEAEPERGARGGRRCASRSLGSPTGRGGESENGEEEEEQGQGQSIKSTGRLQPPRTPLNRERGGCDKNVSRCNAGGGGGGGGLGGPAAGGGSRSSEVLQVLLRLQKRNSEPDGALKSPGCKH